MKGVQLDSWNKKALLPVFLLILHCNYEKGGKLLENSLLCVCYELQWLTDLFVFFEDFRIQCFRGFFELQRAALRLKDCHFSNFSLIALQYLL